MRRLDCLALGRVECEAVCEWFAFMEKGLRLPRDRRLLLKLAEAIRIMKARPADVDIFFLSRSEARTALAWYLRVPDAAADASDGTIGARLLRLLCREA